MPRWSCWSVLMLLSLLLPGGEAALSADVPGAALQIRSHSNEVSPFVYQLTVFVVAIFVGYYVVWSVTPSLHTPLMSVTNAISGIILVGGMVVLGSGAGFTADILSAVAIFLASINVAGGFLVTQRMLRMFRK